MPDLGQLSNSAARTAATGLRIKRKDSGLTMEVFPRMPQLAMALTVVASVVGYLLLVQNSQIDRKHLSALVIQHTGVQTLKPTPVASELIAPAKSQFTEMKKAWSFDPGQTGGYGKERSGSTASGDAATQLVELLPSSIDPLKASGLKHRFSHITTDQASGHLRITYDSQPLVGP